MDPLITTGIFQGNRYNMAEHDRIKWNSKYEHDRGGMDPSQLLKDHIHHAAKGNALDIACGNGRNSVFLAEHGFHVDAVDISDVIIEKIPSGDDRIHAMCLDLDSWKLPPDRYQLIINIRFLDRALFAAIMTGLVPGGLLIFESFVSTEDDPYCLKPNELLHAFLSFQILFYEEKKLPASARFDTIASLVAKKP